jgi:hypothetical protein
MKDLKDLSIESLREFTGNYQDIVVTGDILSSIGIPFEISAREFLQFATQDLDEHECDRHIVNALSNTKRAFECQVDCLLVAFGLFSLSKSRRWNLPWKREVLNSLGVVAPEILKRITGMRNILEHEYVRPSAAGVRDALDLARLFIEATEVFLAREWRNNNVENVSTDSAVAVTLNYAQGTIVLESKAKKVLTADSEEYLDYLRWFIPLMKKWG